MTNLEYCNEILSIIGNVTEANDAIYNLAYDAYQKLGGQESKPTLATIYNELKGAIQIWDNTDNLTITENGTYNLLGKIITVNVQGGGSVPSDEIWYTSSDGNIVTPSAYGWPNIISNTYSDGKGVIKFSSNITQIGNDSYNKNTSTFYGKSTLQTITIPSNITVLGDYAFCLCSSLKDINLDNITYIGARALEGCAFSTMTIPNSVTFIGGSSFVSCNNLTSLTIGNGVTEIYGGAFSNCRNLTSISYVGTISQWNAIIKGNLWHYNVPATVVHCTDGDTPI